MIRPEDEFTRLERVSVTLYGLGTGSVARMPRGIACGEDGSEDYALGTERPLDPERAAEPPRAVVRLCAVVIDEDMAVATVTEEGASELPDLIRCLHPTRRLRIKVAQLLQRAIFFFGQKLYTHGRGHIQRIVFWTRRWLPRFPPFTVVTHISATCRAFR